MTTERYTMTPPPEATAAEIEQLRRTAENPLAKPSERVAARRKLADLGEVPARRLAGDDKRAALHVARRLIWDGMPD